MYEYMFYRCTYTCFTDVQIYVFYRCKNTCFTDVQRYVLQLIRYIFYS